MGKLASHSANENFVIRMGSEDCYHGFALLSLSTVKDDLQNCPLLAWQLVTLKSPLTCRPHVRQPTHDCVMVMERGTTPRFLHKP